MIEISQGAGAVVADDARLAMKAMDDAILASTRMCASFLEATDGAGVPAGLSQGTLRSMASGINMVVDARGGMVDALRQMLVIKRNSTAAWYDYGCPTGHDAVAPVKADAAPVVGATV